MAKEIKPINKIIPLIIYPFDVMISINENYDQFADAVMKRWDREILNDFKKREAMLRKGGLGVTALLTSESHRACMIKIGEFTKDPQSHGTLAHEIFHAVEFVLRICGMKVSSTSHEAYAYLVGYITEKVLDLIQDECVKK